MVLQKMYKKYNTLLKTKQYTVGRTNDRKTSHLSKTNYRKKETESFFPLMIVKMLQKVNFTLQKISIK